MIDREKVEQGIKACWSKHFYHSCCDCPYMINRDDKKCVERLATDVLALLKEQQERIETLESLRRIEQEGR